MPDSLTFNSLEFSLSNNPRLKPIPPQKPKHNLKTPRSIPMQRQRMPHIRLHCDLHSI